MRKTFIEAATTPTQWTPSTRKSLPLMRKTFIEALDRSRSSCTTPLSLFRLCGRLSLRPGVAWAAQELGVRLFRLCGRLSLRRRKRLHGLLQGCRCLFRLCGRLSLRWGTSPRVRQILLFPPLLWRLSLRAGEVRIYPQLWFSAAYIAEFHF